MEQNIESVIKIKLRLRNEQKSSDGWIFTYKGEKKSVRFRDVEFIAATLEDAISSFLMSETEHFTISNKY